MQRGDRVRITGARGTVHGRVEEIRKPEELPDLEHMPAGPAREVLSEIEVSRVAILSYAYGRARATLLFAALESEGRWYDLQGQELSIVRIPPASAQKKPPDRAERAS
jgi:hypothetical protein